MNGPRRDLLIVGHGLAGALLAWECESAGIDFAVADDGRPGSATAAAAGIINPITGRRLVPGWRSGELLPAARAAYRAIEATLGVPLWRELRVRRLFADERERAAFATKHARGELAPYAGPADVDGFLIDGAARVDLAALLAHSRARWERAGRWHAGAIDPLAAAARHGLVVDCTGVAAARAAPWAFVPWEFSKGELLELAVADLDPGVLVNRRQWLLPVSSTAALVGATHEPGVTDATPTPAARTSLAAAARDLVGDERPLTITAQRAGVRATLPDKHPVAGRHPTEPRLGLINALGAKGAIWAPWLARQWSEHVARGAPFDAEIDVRRFAVL